MLDLTKSIEPKSDQLNADDLIAGPKVLEITGVKRGSDEQPINIHYSGDDGKPWKPCKGMIRVLVSQWGKDGDKFVGKSVKVYNDPSVKWAGGEVGGIRISHMSDIEKKIRIMVTVSRGKKIPMEVEPLVTKPLNTLTDDVFDALSNEMEAAENMVELSAVGDKIIAGEYDKVGADRLKGSYKESVKRIREDSE